MDRPIYLLYHVLFPEQSHDTKAEDVCNKTFAPVMKTVEDNLRDIHNIKDKKAPYKTFWYWVLL